jgi:hypothetical protein
MKYADFYKCLKLKVGESSINARIGPAISVVLGETPKISFKQKELLCLPQDTSDRFIIFPVKIYGETIHHLNILFLDKKTKIIERYEPFNQSDLFFNQVNDLIEPLLYKLMEQKKIYFIWYQSWLNTENVLNDKNCGLHCIKYVLGKIQTVKEDRSKFESPVLTIF